MIKFVVMFRQTGDWETFENAYTDFLALIERMPDIRRRQAIHVLGSPQGDAPYNRGLEIYFDTQDALRASLMSPAGQEAGNELARFPEGSFDVYFSEIYEESGGNTPQPTQDDITTDDDD
ncbi:MAG: EthD family reductase [Chloroflexota bacterium]